MATKLIPLGDSMLVERWRPKEDRRGISCRHCQEKPIQGKVIAAAGAPQRRRQDRPMTSRRGTDLFGSTPAPKVKLDGKGTSS